MSVHENNFLQQEYLKFTESSQNNQEQSSPEASKIKQSPLHSLQRIAQKITSRVFQKTTTKKSDHCFADKVGPILFSFHHGVLRWLTTLYVARVFA